MVDGCAGGVRVGVRGGCVCEWCGVVCVCWGANE